VKKKITIGRKDKADFPELGLIHLDIKMDTGAYTSAIHCHKIKREVIDGKEILKFTLLDPTHSQYENKALTKDKFTEKWIKNSFGGREKRFVIKTEIFIFEKKYAIELSLSERKGMRFPILIGRRFLMGKFIVDPSKYDISYKLVNPKANKAVKSNK
jgi:hypothetical protein